MVEDQYGELHPQIDDNLCVKCGMCEKSVQNLNKTIYIEMENLKYMLVG